MKAITFFKWVGHLHYLPLGLRYRFIKALFDEKKFGHQILTGNDFQGNKFFLQIDSFVDWSIYFLGGYEIYILKLLSQICEKTENCTFADVGANIGQHTIFLSRYCSQVYSFEPVPEIIKKLEENIELNGLKNIQVIPCGLGSENTELPFKMPPAFNRGMGHFAKVPTKDGVKLPLITGDSFFLDTDKRIPDLIKIDVEGFENKVLKGLRQTVENARPIILMEYGEYTEKEFNTENGFYGFLPIDYELKAVHSIREYNYRLENFKKGSFYGNILLIPKEKLHLID